MASNDDGPIWYDKINPFRRKDKYQEIEKSFSERLGMLTGKKQTSSPKEVMVAYEKSPDLKRVVNVIAMAVAKAEPYVNNSGKMDEKHPLNAILNRPNQYMTTPAFLATCQLYLDLVGEFYIYILKSSDGYELFPIAPTAITWKDDKITIEFMGRLLEGKREGKDYVRILQGTPLDPYLLPSSMGSTLSQEIEISEDAATHEASYLKNSARKQILLQMKGVNADSAKLFRDSWNNNSGPDQSGKLLITTADISAIPLENDWDSEGLLQLRRHSSEKIREAYGVPPEILGNVENSNRATIGAAEYLFSSNVVQPRVNSLLAALTMKIVPILYPNENLSIEAPSIIPVNEEFILEVVKQKPDAFSEEEIRELAGYAPRNGQAKTVKSLVNYRMKSENILPQLEGNFQNIDLIKALTQYKEANDK